MFGIYPHGMGTAKLCTETPKECRVAVLFDGSADADAKLNLKAAPRVHWLWQAGCVELVNIYKLVPKYYTSTNPNPKAVPPACTGCGKPDVLSQCVGCLRVVH